MDPLLKCRVLPAMLSLAFAVNSDNVTGAMLLQAFTGYEHEGRALAAKLDKFA